MNDTEPTSCPRTEAAAMAIEGEEDGCFERVAAWDALEPWEQESEGEPHTDREDCAYWLRKARAGLAAADVLALSGSVPEATPAEPTVKLTRDTLDGGWIAEFTPMPGCMSQGETIPDALRSLADALAEVVGAIVDAVGAPTEQDVRGDEIIEFCHADNGLTPEGRTVVCRLATGHGGDHDFGSAEQRTAPEFSDYLEATTYIDLQLEISDAYMGEAGDLVRDHAQAVLALRSARQSIEGLPGMCHWKQNRGGCADRESHEAFHYGSPCPYEAMAAVLRGEPDPRELPSRDSTAYQEWIAKPDSRGRRAALGHRFEPQVPGYCTCGELVHEGTY